VVTAGISKASTVADSCAKPGAFELTVGGRTNSVVVPVAVSDGPAVTKVEVRLVTVLLSVVPVAEVVVRVVLVRVLVVHVSEKLTTRPTGIV